MLAGQCGTKIGCDDWHIQLNRLFREQDVDGVGNSLDLLVLFRSWCQQRPHSKTVWGEQGGSAVYHWPASQASCALFIYTVTMFNFLICLSSQKALWPISLPRNTYQICKVNVSLICRGKINVFLAKALWIFIASSFTSLYDLVIFSSLFSPHLFHDCQISFIYCNITTFFVSIKRLYKLETHTEHIYPIFQKQETELQIRNILF